MVVLNNRHFFVVAVARILTNQKQERNFVEFLSCFWFAEREGFEPPVPLSTSVFKTGAIDHSATFPICFYVKYCGRFKFDVANVRYLNESAKFLSCFLL